MAKKKETYSQAMARLETIVRQVDSNELEIDELVEKNKEAIDSPYQSENVIGVYSYTLKSGSGGSGSSSGKGNSASWENQFYCPLNQWRKLS